MLVNVVVNGLNKPLTYSIPKSINQVGIGYQVEIPLRSRNVTGIITEILESSKKTKFKTKEIISGQPFFQNKQISFFSWMSKYYGTPLCDILESASIKLKEEPQISVVKLKQKLSIEEIDKLISKRAHLQKKILSYLIEEEKPVKKSSLQKLFPSADNAIKSILKKDLIEINLEKCKKLDPEELQKINIHTLNKNQENAVNAIIPDIVEEKFSPYLLFGVTGSGKTEVYMKLMHQALQSKKSVLFLVPEISLTPHLCKRLELGLGTSLAVLHSQISQVEKSNLWRNIISGHNKIIVGARSALFAPIPNLGLVIVDEEHDSSYKQSDNFRYHARDCAVVLAKTSNCPIVLGSATPSFETLFNVKNKKYKIQEINIRANNKPLPQIQVVDLLKSPKKTRPSENITTQLKDKIQKTLEDRNQAIILYNKRGFASYLFCKTCVEVVMCPRCSVSLTYHQNRGKLLCHYCDYSSGNTTTCPTCTNSPTVETENNPDYGTLSPYGAGTEKVYEELISLFPKANIARMDRDTVTKKGAHEKIINSMLSGEADILVGTKMIAKGHDIPNVTLVGIIDADIGLHFPDFRANESVFQLISQAGGRAGRGSKEGEVIIQTCNPENPTIRAAVENRFKAFAQFELENRKKYWYPPHCSILRIVISDEIKSKANELSKTLKSFLEKAYHDSETDYKILFIGPSTCAKQKINDRYRFHMIVKAQKASQISKIAKLAYHFKGNFTPKSSRIVIDVDPYDML